MKSSLHVAAFAAEVMGPLESRVTSNIDILLYIKNSTQSELKEMSGSFKTRSDLIWF